MRIEINVLSSQWFIRKHYQLGLVRLQDARATKTVLYEDAKQHY